MIDMEVPPFLFVIDTDSYAGNFEREMCAFITGIVGDCEVGLDTAKAMIEEFRDFHVRLHNITLQVPDEHGCHRPVTIYPTPGYGCDGNGNEVKLTEDNRRAYQHPSHQSVAILMGSVPDQGLIDFMKDRAIKFSQKYKSWAGESITVIGFRLIEQSVVAKTIEV